MDPDNKHIDILKNLDVRETNMHSQLSMKKIFQKN